MNYVGITDKAKWAYNHGNATHSHNSQTLKIITFPEKLNIQQNYIMTPQKSITNCKTLL